MNALIVAVTERPSAQLPPVVQRKISAFLAAGNTGKITLNVKEGRVLAYEITDTGRVSALDLDSRDGDAQD